MRKRLGQILKDERVINRDQLEQALELQKHTNLRLGEALVRLGFISEMELGDHISRIFKVPLVDLTRVTKTLELTEALKLIPAEFAHSYRVVPLAVRKVQGAERLILALSDLSVDDLVRDIEFRTGYRTFVMLATGSALLDALRRFYPPAALSPDHRRIHDLHEVSCVKEPSEELEIVRSERRNNS